MFTGGHEDGVKFQRSMFASIERVGTFASCYVYMSNAGMEKSDGGGRWRDFSVCSGKCTVSCICRGANHSFLQIALDLSSLASAWGLEGDDEDASLHVDLHVSREVARVVFREPEEGIHH